MGDIIRVDDDFPVPADCFLLASEKNKCFQTDGQCFISMESLNGERALDPKMAIKEVIENLKPIVTGGGKDLLLEIQCKTGPISNLSEFDGKLKIVEPHRQYPLEDLSIK